MSECDGFANYETWSVIVCIKNDQALYRYWRSVALQSSDVDALAETMEEEFEAKMPEIRTGVYRDLLGHALGNVDWHECAETILQGL